MAGWYGKWADGARIYSVAVGAVYSSPAIDAQGTIYVGSTGGSVFAINPNNSLKWNYTTGGAVFSSPTIGADGSVYVGSYDGKLYCFGSPIILIGATISSGGSGYTTPHVVLVGGGGTGATATARVSQGVIFGIVLTNPGSGYTSPPTIVFRDPESKS